MSNRMANKVGAKCSRGAMLNFQTQTETVQGEKKKKCKDLAFLAYTVCRFDY